MSRGRLLPAGLLLVFALGMPPAPAAEGPDADEAILKAEGLRSDDAALLDFFRKRTLSPAELARLAETVRQFGDRSFAVREKASADLLAAGRRALPFLRPAMKDADLEIAHRAERCVQALESGTETALTLAAVRLLAERKPAGATEVLLNYLPFADDVVVEEQLLATLGAVAVRDGKIDTRLASALTDAAPARRAAAALIMGQSAAKEQRTAVRSLLADTDAKVRLRAAQGLVGGKDKAGVPTLIALLSESPPEVSWLAEEMLCHIAGDQAPLVSSGTMAAERRHCRQAWAAWWERNETAFDVARLDSGQRSLGLTLIVAYDGYGGKDTSGRIWERRPDGKVSWEITDIKGPLDARVLPGNRVLIAEYDGRRVTERNLQGKVLWEHNLGASQQPLGCLRLANGNTLIGTNNTIFEITPDHRQVASYAARNGTIFSFQKLRNGRLVYVTFEGTLVEVDEKGNEVKTLHFERPRDGLVTVEVTSAGHYLVPLTAAGKVAEFDAEGKIVAQYPMPHPNAATRLPNGNLVACSRSDRRVVEMDCTGRVLWEERQQGHLFRVRRR